MPVITPKEGEGLIQLAERCDAVYQCIKANDGRWLGKLVVFNGTDPETGKHYVGRVYFNFAAIEPHLPVVEEYARAIATRLQNEGLLDSFDTICGIPSGGQTLAQMLASILRKRYVYLKQVPTPTPEGQKQKYGWDLSRFEFEPEERVACVEDVFNNFKNTHATLNMLAAAGAIPTMLLGALNRSTFVDSAFEYQPTDGPAISLPVICSIRERYLQYRQEDPEVAADVAAGNVEWNVKPKWRALMEDMRRNRTLAGA